MKKIRGIPVPWIVVVVLIVLVGGYYGVRALTGGSKGQLKASGTIEAVDVNVSPELSGKVAEVLVDEGQAVKTGDPLFRLDGTLLSAQHAAAAAGLSVAQSAAQTAQAAYASAQAQYEITLAAARAQDLSTRIQDWSGLTPNYFDQPKWYFTQAEQIAAAQAEVGAAQANLTAAQNGLDKVVSDLNNAKFLDAEQRLANARVAYLVALQVSGQAQASNGGNIPPDKLPGVHIPYTGPPGFPTGYMLRVKISQNLPNNQALADAGQNAYDDASSELTSAQNAYNDLLTTDAAGQVLSARAAVAVAQQRYEVAQDHLSALQTGADSPHVTAAAAVVEQAKDAAQQAQDAVGQAQANLDLLNAQVSKLTVYAPMDGVILTRNIQPGEFVQPGAAALSMADLSTLTITVYVPEDRYGQISLGQQATVAVDSFPGQTFQAQVSHIADQAEFTPRNVQTVEGRSSTVYAVKLTVSDPAAKLKPGMPADVTFSSK